MNSIAKQLLETASLSKKYLDPKSRKDIAQFVRSKWNADGGVCGRDKRSDLYYTVFGASCLRSLGVPVPLFRLWKYVRSFGLGEELDFVHLVCLARLRTLFPIKKRDRLTLFKNIEAHNTESAYDLFLSLLAQDHAGELHFPDAHLVASEDDPTPNLAATLIVNQTADPDLVRLLLSRTAPSGGFCAGKRVRTPDLLSTATALFALSSLNINLEELRRPCMEFVVSLWRDSGGFAGHVADEYEDVEYTAYALLSIGCLLK